ncbi:helix-turn-helix domain containing protein [Luteibacter sp. PPL201]|uniref:Helix-turn-helix domain containing protein n=1 Tax=Luteibacter sahnii TaxID=3021977 RepID=A0ABT6BD68_9GAMM|nr:helix-turn-helix domain-containing protein [Luteibacter sp. PPL193]MDY1550191.1 helix-turn-helix domain containing protein [Luteibacter sp. PPL193]
MRTPTPPRGRREENKQAVRARLVDASLVLFARQGYDMVSVDDIAAAAGVSRRTFFNYFAGKEEVVFAWMDAARDRLVHGIREANPRLSPRAILREGVLALVDALPATDLVSVGTLVHDTPLLRARQLLNMEAWETELAGALTARLPRLSRIDARYLAMGALGALRVAVLRCMESRWTLHPRRTVDDGLKRLWPELAHG